MEENNNIISSVADYYEKKIKQYGETAQGVDWNGEESQILRFEQLSKVIDCNDNFSVNDLGCGYGAFYDFLSLKYDSFTYYGYDICEEMINVARSRYIGKEINFFVSDKPVESADFSIASGIFNVRLECDDNRWWEFIKKTLNFMNQCSVKGFSFNCLTAYSHKDKMRDYLYYADPCFVFDYCIKTFSRNVTISHGYKLYEFTVLVKK